MKRAGWLLLALGCGCNVGPRYVVPSAPVPGHFRETAGDAYGGANTWHPARPEDGAIKGKWWQLFREPELDALEDRLNIDNQTIRQFFESFMAARAQVNQARAAYFPTVSTSPSYTYSGTGGSGGGGFVPTGTVAGGTASNAGAFRSSGNTNNFYSLPLGASWAPDLWDRVRNTVRQARYSAQVSAADLENERLTEQASLAEFYFELRGQDSLQDLYNRTIEADRQSLDLTRAQFATGVGTAEAVAQAEVVLANVEAAGVGIATNRALFEHAIATLIGKPASDFTMPVKLLATPVPAIPLGVPSELLQRRPDIAAAERTLAAANALIGVNKAAYYPSLNLSASGGLASSALSTLFSAPSLFWSLGASLAETIFDGGLRDATVAQSEALYRADVAGYRQVVLTAFQQVEDFLATVRLLSEQIARQDAAVSAAQRFLDIAMASYRTGLQPYLDVITAQTLLLGDQETLVTLQVNEMMAAVELVQALGGGWDVGRLPSASEVTSEKGVKKVSGPGS